MGHLRRPGFGRRLFLGRNLQRIVNRRRHPILASSFAAWLLLFALSFAAAAEDLAPGSRVGIGWDGHVVLGRWNVAEIVWPNQAAATYRLDVTATDPDGNLATYKGEDIVSDAGIVHMSGRFQLGRPDGSITLQVFRDGSPWGDPYDPMAHNPFTPGPYGPVIKPHTQSELFLVTVGLPETQQQLFDPAAPGRRTPIHLKSTAELPTDDLAFDSVAGLLLAGPELVSESHAAAINRWVRRGGRLYLSVGLPPQEYRESPLFKQLPLEMAAEPIPTRELTSLESYAGKTVRILPPGLRLMIPKISARDGRVLAGGRGDVVLLRAPHGFGQVTLLGLDLTQSPLSVWNAGLGDLLRKMTDGEESNQPASARGNRLGSIGMTDMASQLAAGLEHFESVRRASPWWVMGGLIGVMLLIGPLDYWLTSRICKRPLATWISFPILLAACAAASAWAAGSGNGDRFQFNQLDIVDLDSVSGAARSRHFVTLFSPEASSARVAIKPNWAAWSEPKSAISRRITSWTGLPEASFGGMYRSGSGILQFQQSDYQFDAGGDQATGLPVAQWSTATLQTQADGVGGELVESKLASSATGRLSGTVMHRLPGPLTDWFLTYAGRIYRLPVSEKADSVIPLEPNTLWRVEQPNVVQRELRGFLTRTRAREVAGKGNRVGGDLVLQQANYDPLRRDLKEILPALTFYAEIGGNTYTGLANDALAEQDLTPLLNLDRAILFGYLETQAADVTVVGEPDAAMSRTTLVRMLLPVDRAQQGIRDLQDFDPNKKKKP